MFDASHRQSSLPTAPPAPSEVQQLHARCGVYTKPEIVAQILDAVGWTQNSKLFDARLLEPAAGNGAFVVEAAKRLVRACRRYNVHPRFSKLRNCITSFELHRTEATRARRNIVAALVELDVHPTSAKALAKAWITHGDFLLSNNASVGYTHVVGNPPYVRWSKIPTKLRAAYAKALPRAMIGGDLFLPFLDSALEQLLLGGRCGFLCSDRWRFMAFAESFRKKWLPRLEITSETSLLSSNAFLDNVDIYPSILIAKRRRPKAPSKPPALIRRTLSDRGYVVKVGPALGHTPAFVLGADEHDVEEDLLRPWIAASEIQDGKLVWQGRRVATMHQSDGSLVDLKQFPRLRSRLNRFKEPLKARSIVLNGAPWYRPIDNLTADAWQRPKILIPELAKVPRLAIDLTGAIPSHGVYAIFAPDDKIDNLYERLEGGQLATALKDIAPTVKGGFVRCYKRFLDMIILDS
ncbi:MAG: hypothetical protein AB1582_04330 [Pseudomonadota bacterium]